MIRKKEMTVVLHKPISKAEREINVFVDCRKCCQCSLSDDQLKTMFEMELRD